MTSTQTVEEDGVRRRDWIHIAAISFAGVGAGAGFVITTNNENIRLADVCAFRCLVMHPPYEFPSMHCDVDKHQ
ncbi:MAG: ubiquinol-cytochrome c reductase iron-sulfur subunit N-terminal domain-containing protein, partial [Pseudomonadota bacterium]